MSDLPSDLRDRLREARQEHLLHGWETLSPARRQEFVAQIAAIDFAELAELVKQARDAGKAAPVDQIEPLPVSPARATPEEHAAGEEALSRGEVAALLVAGGQGTRLGFDKPKGMYPVGPVSGATLFRIHAEKILALSRRHSTPMLFLVMTSHATDAETREEFAANRFYGLDPANVIFFQQGTMPAVCERTGRLLLEEPGRLFLSPNGHGGTLTALAERGVLRELDARGVKHVYYFQVDNPLLKICDAGFLGQHIRARAEVSSKVVFKERVEEKVGVFAVVNGRCGLIEYSDMPPQLAAARESNGTLRFRAGNPAIHLFELVFLKRVIREAGLPYHVARKAVPHYDHETRQVVTPKEPNALKFERFIFDALPLADRWLAVETPRAEEFSPLKNATGADSPDTVREHQIALFTNWLERAGVATHGHAVEVSPLFALDADELRQKLPTGLKITGPTHLQ
jgi:UDP-N-acetylglucosamine/UDP-N-acetylgalactosamine diphosphorylase